MQADIVNEEVGCRVWDVLPAVPPTFDSISILKEAIEARHLTSSQGIIELDALGIVAIDRLVRQIDEVIRGTCPRVNSTPPDTLVGELSTYGCDGGYQSSGSTHIVDAELPDDVGAIPKQWDTSRITSVEIRSDSTAGGVVDPRRELTDGRRHFPCFTSSDHVVIGLSQSDHPAIADAAERTPGCGCLDLHGRSKVPIDTRAVRSTGHRCVRQTRGRNRKEVCHLYAGQAGHARQQGAGRCGECMDADQRTSGDNEVRAVRFCGGISIPFRQIGDHPGYGTGKFALVEGSKRPFNGGYLRDRRARSTSAAPPEAVPFANVRTGFVV